MSRILLADDSPHAQRMGERILREEGYEVVTVTDGNTALVRLADVDPDVVFADVSLPSHSGYEICKNIKSNPRHRHVRVILTAGLLEPFDDQQAKDAGCDGVLKKPFESSVVLSTVKPLMAAALKERESQPKIESKPDQKPEVTKAPEVSPPPVVASQTAPPEVSRFELPLRRIEVPPATIPVSSAAPPPPIQTAPVPPPHSTQHEKRVPDAIAARMEQVFQTLPRAVPVRILTDAAPPEPVSNGAISADAERVRAAVTLALDAALPSIIDKVTEQVLVALGHLTPNAR